MKKPLKVHTQPLYTQSAYEATLAKDQCTVPAGDDYWQFADRVTEDERSHMVVVIEELILLRKYFDRTHFLAVNLCDRYIYSLFQRGEVPKCLMDLAVTAVFLAGKLEQHICPSLAVLLTTIEQEWNVSLNRQAIVDLEEAIIKELDFDLLRPISETFLDRYFMLFGVEPSDKRPEVK